MKLRNGRSPISSACGDRCRRSARGGAGRPSQHGERVGIVSRECAASRPRCAVGMAALMLIVLDVLLPLTGKTLTAIGHTWSFGTRQGYNGFEVLVDGKPAGFEASKLETDPKGGLSAEWHDAFPWNPKTGKVGVPRYHKMIVRPVARQSTGTKNRPARSR